MERYIAITIGPIFDTINLASSPAALWTGSYLFSYLTKTLCRLLVEQGVPEEDILTPYFTMGDDQPKNSDGVGLYHDRIIFREGNFQIADFRQVRENAITHLAQTFGVDADYLREYLLIAAAVCEAENPILDTAKVLDCLELAKPVVQPRQNNPLMSLLVGEKYYGNENIKALPLTTSFRNWQLRKPNGQLRSIPDIAGVELNTGLKKHRYYAVVRADGDHMGDIIASLDSGSIRDFSRDCIFYCAKIAGLVQEFGGVAIYSGGDDLLAILPCENAQGQTVFEFVRRANRIFDESFPYSKYHKNVSLSFGVTICYYKFPLYEALEDSQKMLFGIAKSRRSCMAVHLQKHAGQSEGLVVSNSALDELIGLYESCVSKADGEWFSSIHHKLHLFRSMIAAAGADQGRIYNLFRNLFDADAHQDNTLILEVLPEFYHKLKTELDIRSVEEVGEQDEIDTLCYLLRLFKFYVEKGGEGE